MNSVAIDLRVLFERLHGYFGDQHWWPADSNLEMIIGAILTQNTSWKNVERVIKNLKSNNLLTLDGLYSIDIQNLEEQVRSSGFYKQKALRIKNFVNVIKKDFNGNLDFFLEQYNIYELMTSIKGIGKETAESIMLYAANRPVFVIDIYTLRILKRLGFDIREDKKDYDKAQSLFYRYLNKDTNLYKEYHALLVQLGKLYCKKIPDCENCPVQDICEKAI